MKWFLIFVVLSWDGEPQRAQWPMEDAKQCVAAEEAAERLLLFTRQGRNSVIVECVGRFAK